MIELRFERSNTCISRAIRVLTFSEWSHVDLVLPDRRLLGAVAPRGVMIRNAYDTHPSDIRVGFVFCNDAITQRVHEFCARQVGKPYDWLALAGWLARRRWDDHDAWFCSELIAAAFQYAGYPLLQVDEATRITPRDLALAPAIQWA